MNQKLAQQKCLSLLRSATLCYNQIKAGSAQLPYLAGRGWAFLQAFRHMSHCLGITEGDAYAADLEKLLRPHVEFFGKPHNKPEEAIAIPEPTKEEASEIEIEVEVAIPKETPLYERTDLPNHKAIVLGHIREALRKKGFNEKDSYLRAYEVHKNQGTMDELIAKASL